MVEAMREYTACLRCEGDGSPITQAALVLLADVLYAYESGSYDEHEELNLSARFESNLRAALLRGEPLTAQLVREARAVTLRLGASGGVAS